MIKDEDVAEVRHVVQRILVPCVFVIGLLGNSVSIYVLTRKRMRCTTNIYLTALAITDIIFLTMGLLLSLQHYDYVQRHCEYYWMCYGIVVWLCDACAYISIYIAVCFTIERFIAIRYPLKRQTFCTESLAKKVITGVALFCLLSTISTAFEHQYGIGTKLIDSYGKPCNLTPANASPSAAMSSSLDFNDLNGFEGSGNGPDVQLDNKANEDANALLRSKWMAREATSAAGAVNIPNIASDFLSSGSSDVLLDAEFLTSVTTVPVLSLQMEKYAKRNAPAKMADYNLQQQQQQLYQQELQLQQPNDSSVTFTITEYCQNVTFYINTNSPLAQNTLYTRIWYFFTLFVFFLIPLCVLATFNCFLIMLVRRSKNLRGAMTNASSMRRTKRKTHSSVSQENRVTVTLIAVVLLFIICQLPWAICLILFEQVVIERNLRAIIGNIFNFLAAINAAANFFLYCVLSDKYRKTVRELITGYKYRSQRNTNTTESLYTNATANGSRRYRAAASSSSMVIK